MGANSEPAVESSVLVSPRVANPPTPIEPTAYGRAFWCTYLANAAMMIAFAMLYRYADFVLFLGGNEWTVGRIVGVGTVGSLAMRLFQGTGIDRFGPRTTITRDDLNAMFAVAAGLGVCSLILAELATRGETRPRPRRRPHLLWLVRRYHPGIVMVLGTVMGVGFVLPTTFLPTYIKELGIAHTGPFFIVYSVTAFIARLSTRRMPHRFGVRPMIFVGLAALVVSMFAYLPVRSQWSLAVPGVFAGISHAVLFPAVTAQGSWAFPNRYRGLGTTVMLAMLDLGTFVGAPLVGGLVEVSKSTNLPPYPTMFLVLAAGVSAVGALYAFSTRRAVSSGVS